MDNSNEAEYEQWRNDMLNIWTYEAIFTLQQLFDKGIMMAFEDDDYYYIYTDPHKEEGYMDPCPTGLDNPNPLWIIGKHNGVRNLGWMYALLEVCDEAQRPGTVLKEMKPPYKFGIDDTCD